MNGMPKLNLGCGYGYIPGYVNIDTSERSVADSFKDVADLPYEPNSVGAIEAVQLIEHFDAIHCRYLLAEWFRILAVGGTLTLETPDLAKTLKKFVSNKTKDKEATLQWLYGIDSPGLQHKSGFTFDLIERLLSETGFVDIKRKKATTHTYEPGMRVECRKPERCDEAQFMSGLRKRCRQSLGLSDSYVMIPFEAWIRRIREEVGAPTALNRERLRKVICASAPYNPRVSLCVLEECVSQGLFERSELEREFEVLDHLVSAQFHQRAFSMWAKSRKERRADEEFHRFLGRLEQMVVEMLERPGRRDEIMGYLMTLDPRPIEMLDICLITQMSKKLLSVGIKRFHEGRIDDAESAFHDSLDLNPDNSLAHWNLARLGIVSARTDAQILMEYSLAAEKAPNGDILSSVKDEADRFRKNPSENPDTTPICETDLV